MTTLSSAYNANYNAEGVPRKHRSTGVVRLPSPHPSCTLARFNHTGARMQEIQRRSFLQLALATLPLPMLGQTTLGQTTAPAATRKPVRIPAGMDSEEKKRAIGLSSTTYKVLSQETGGALFVMEQSRPAASPSPRCR